MRKKSEEDEQTLEESNTAHRRSQPKWQLVQTSYLKRVKLLLFLPYNKLLINRAKSICMGESWPRSCVRSVLTTSVKILPYRPPARLIRAKYQTRETVFHRDIKTPHSGVFWTKCLNSRWNFVSSVWYIFSNKSKTKTYTAGVWQLRTRNLTGSLLVSDRWSRDAKTPVMRLVDYIFAHHVVGSWRLATTMESRNNEKMH